MKPTALCPICRRPMYVVCVCVCMSAVGKDYPLDVMHNDQTAVAHVLACAPRDTTRLLNFRHGSHSNKDNIGLGGCGLGEHTSQRGST
jgi:hypothetical protein